MLTNYKAYLLFGAFALFFFVSCDKVENPLPDGGSGGSDPWEWYPDGNEQHYIDNAWPTFSENTNTDRNILIEEYTGHICSGCPAAAVVAHDIYDNNPGRVVLSSIHAGPGGTGGFQILNPSTGHNTIFYNDISAALGTYFGDNWSGSPFITNPYGAISRVDGNGSGSPMLFYSSWTPLASTILSNNDLKVNIQAETNFYPSTNGLFVHVEVDTLQDIPNPLNIVVQLHEDSLVAMQSISGGYDPDYVHEDILRDCLDGYAFGQPLDNDHLDQNGKYYYFYQYKLDEQYNPSNMHLVIYVRDAVTEEVYQVIKKDFY